MKAFTIASTPQLHFGAGKISVLPSAIKVFGSKILLITGSKSFSSSSHFESLQERLRRNDIAYEQYAIPFEPTPELIDNAVRMFSPFNVEVVVAIGGGSVLDAGTTYGTGSEATKNAVLSEVGENGYKKSLRHNNFVPNVAVIDQELTLSCPPDITAASGMDAFTQLLESYLSTTASPITDALALQGLTYISSSLTKAYRDGHDIKARTDMALASYLSGITLANAGLGLVHGFASSVGGYYHISHGIICSTLMAASNNITVRKLRSNKGHEALSKYATAGKIFASEADKPESHYIDFILDLIENWSKELGIPTLKQCGVKAIDHEKIVSYTDNKNNPVPLSRDEMLEVLQIAG
jgi:alcohol dehydrogenase class IV